MNMERTLATTPTWAPTAEEVIDIIYNNKKLRKVFQQDLWHEVLCSYYNPENISSKLYSQKHAEIISQIVCKIKVAVASSNNRRELIEKIIDIVYSYRRLRISFYQTKRTDINYKIAKNDEFDFDYASDIEEHEPLNNDTLYHEVGDSETSDNETIEDKIEPVLRENQKVYNDIKNIFDKLDDYVSAETRKALVESYYDHLDRHLLCNLSKYNIPDSRIGDVKKLLLYESAAIFVNVFIHFIKKNNVTKEHLDNFHIKRNRPKSMEERLWAAIRSRFRKYLVDRNAILRQQIAAGKIRVVRMQINTSEKNSEFIYICT